MNLRHAAILSFVFVAIAHADPGPDELSFLAIPGAEKITPEGWAIPTLDKIPPALQKLFSHYDWGSPYGSVPKQIHRFCFDLKHEGKNAYFIANLALSGSGRTGYMVFYQFPNAWKLIADFQGPLYRYPTKQNTWPILVWTGRGGGGVWSKSYLKYSAGEYHTYAFQYYDRGIITWKKP